MSSILKALKKIEEESPPSQSHPSLPQTADAQKAVKTKVRKRWSVHRLTAACSILLVMVIAAVIVFSQRQLIIAKIFPAGVAEKKKDIVASPSQKSKIYRAKISSPSTKPAVKLPKQTQKAERQANRTAPANNIKKSQAKPRSMTPGTNIGRQNSKMQTAARDPRPDTMPKYKTPQKKKSPTQKVSRAKKSNSGNSAVSNKPAAKTKKPSRTETYDRIHDSKLKLQALAWFRDASKRMVVINGRIVREGGSVDGYQITQIRQEDVVVNDGRKKWSLEFRLKP